MIYYCYAIHDQKTGSFAQPFYAINAEVAARLVVQSALKTENVVGQFPMDFSLFALGSFDDELGAFQNLQSPQNLGSVAALKKGMSHAQE